MSVVCPNFQPPNCLCETNYNLNAFRQLLAIIEHVIKLREKYTRGRVKTSINSSLEITRDTDSCMAPNSASPNQYSGRSTLLKLGKRRRVPVDSDNDADAPLGGLESCPPSSSTKTQPVIVDLVEDSILPSDKENGTQTNSFSPRNNEQSPEFEASNINDEFEGEVRLLS